jgi:hygromycin-B 4-O-kinase
MHPAPNTPIDAPQAHAFLAAHFDPAATAVERIGAGAWSQAFGFRRGADDLVVRFGHHVDDFRKDERAYAFATPDLPIPEVLRIGPAFDGYYAISRRANGVVLESLDADGWQAIFPALVAAFEAMRLANLAGTTGFGSWGGATGAAEQSSWPKHLLLVGEDRPEQRTHGWRARLADSPEDEATFAWGFELLKQVLDDSAPRSLIHADLINRNVLVQGERITGVFDWGCARYGDHLYDLAWFEFWSPWYPELDMAVMRATLEARWRAVGYVPHNQAARLLACHLHIGLDHLAYNAFRGNQENLRATADRMRAVIRG